jgi:hypothetical protein
MRAAPYSRELMERRRAGERIGLVVVALDWQAGRDMAKKPNVARVVAPDEFDVRQASWSALSSLDVVLVGGDDPQRFYAAATAIWRASVASLWGEFDDGFHRLAPQRHGGWIAEAGPYAEAKLGAALRCFRDCSLLCASGVYGLPAFAAARRALFDLVFGNEAVQAMRAVTQARHEAAGIAEKAAA